MKKFVKAYCYRDESGKPLYDKVRYEPKSFAWRQFTESGTFRYGLGSVRRVLYNLPAVWATQPNDLILFVEGEKDVDALNRLGYVATTSGSSQGWGYLVRNHSVHLALSDRHVWIIADKDAPGRALAKQVATTLSEICPVVKLLELPGDDVKDAYDVIEAHGHQARQIIDDTGNRAPVFRPPSAKDKPHEEEEQPPTKEKKTKFKLLDEMITETEWEFFFDQFGETWVSMMTKGHMENHSVHSERFRDVVRARYRALMGEGLSKEIIDQVISAKRGTLDPRLNSRVLEQRIVADETNNSILVDTGRSDWQVIRITSEGYQLVYPVINPFRRDPNIGPYDIDVDTACGPWEPLFEVIAPQDEDSRGLIKMWMALTMIPGISKPGLIINGPPGAGKTFCAETIRQIVDPSENPLQAFPRDMENLKLSLFKNHIPNFDNMNRLDPDQSDCLCQAVTGITFEKRKLHTDADTIRWKVKRQWMLTGVNIPGSMADFLSRAFIIELGTIDPERRRDAGQLETILNRIRPGIQSRLFECASHALKNYPSVKPNGLQRLAHAHRYCLAMAEPLEMEPDEINRLWTLNSQAQANETVENDVVAQAIIDFAKQEKTWEGTPVNLYSALTGFCNPYSQPWKKSWPASPGNLTKKINHIVDSLKMHGVIISENKTMKQRLKKITYIQDQPQSVMLSPN